ncbi:MAG TPA: phosphoglucosamine mutase [Methanoregulaceae archaeon]|nr:phosphoglucosamine mutase [Methanoregulaceae archaeon]
MASEKLQKKLFGTNGVRGIVGKDMTPELALSIGYALGSMRKGRIAVGRDTRTSGECLSSAVRAGLMATGCDVVDLGILPTPALQYLVTRHFDGGAMITASHNPPEYNGVKIIEPDGTEMGDEETVLLEERLFSKKFEIEPWDKVGSESSSLTMKDHYVRAVSKAFPDDIGKGMSVVVDPGCGAASITTPEILSNIGCRVFSINAQIDGHFPGRLPEPSIEGLKGLSDLVVSTGASVGIAHDGDADRAVFVDENGRFVTEDQEFALVTDYICRDKTGVIVTPVSSSLIVETVARDHGSRVVYTPVGSIYVARTMRELIRKGEPVIFGGEGNGGLIYPDHQFCRDGGMTAAMMVAILAGSDKKLSEMVDNLPKFHTIKEKIKTSKAGEMMAQIERSYTGWEVDRTDGLKLVNGTTWALIRPSGTEPLVRVMVESPEKMKAIAFFDELMSKIKAVS